MATHNIHIAIWALSPGPVAVLTLHESRKNGLMAGVAVSGGATVTATLMVIMAVGLHTSGFSTIIESDTRFMTMIEKIGAFGIILMGLYAGYRSLWTNNGKITTSDNNPDTKLGFLQGMLVMATYIPPGIDLLQSNHPTNHRYKPHYPYNHRVGCAQSSLDFRMALSNCFLCHTHTNNNEQPSIRENL